MVKKLQNYCGEKNLSNAKDSKKYIRVALVLNLQQTKYALQEIYDVLKKNN